MNIVYLSDDYLVPTNSGGRAVVRAEVELLRTLGHAVTLVITHRGKLEVDAASRHSSFADQVAFVKRPGILRQSLASPCKPYQLGSRQLDRQQLLELKHQGPTVIWAAHEWTLEMAERLAAKYDWPVILRSHNHEVSYMVAQAKSGTISRRIYALLEAMRLHINLRRLLTVPDMILLISSADGKAYEDTAKPIDVLRPSFGKRGAKVAEIGNERTSVLFVGALDMPHAVAGLEWFITEVWPGVLKVLPQSILEIAGRSCPESFAIALAASPRIIFHGEVDDLEPLYGRARVFINPVFSGSGLNVKIGSAAIRGIPVITTDFGARGYDPDLLRTATDANSFGDAVVDLLTSDRQWISSAQSIRDLAAQYDDSTASLVIMKALSSVVTESIEAR